MFEKVQSQRKRERIVSEILNSLYNILADNVEQYLDIVMDGFDLKSMIELALPNSFSLSLMRAAIKVLGVILSTDDHVLVKVVEKFNNLHSLLIETI